MKKKEKVLIIAAHPDDEVLGCGGTIARYAKSGFKIYTLILGEGVTSRYLRREKANFSKVGALKKQAEKASRILGIRKTFFGDFPDNRFDSVSLLDIIKKIEKVKKEVEPGIVFTHNGADLNIDHQITCRAVMTAFRPLPKTKVRHIYGFEIPDFKNWGSFQNKEFVPDYYIDISDYLEKKLKALNCYATELRRYPHPRSLTAVKNLAKYRGSACGRKQVEAFKTLLSIN